MWRQKWSGCSYIGALDLMDKEIVVIQHYLVKNSSRKSQDRVCKTGGLIFKNAYENYLPKYRFSPWDLSSIIPGALLVCRGLDSEVSCLALLVNIAKFKYQKYQ